MTSTFTKLILLAIAIWQTPARAAELIWDYDHGWTKGFVLYLDGKTNELTFLDRNTGKTQKRKTVNAENTIKYLSRLASRVTEETSGIQATDGEVQKITIKNNGKELKVQIYGTHAPGAILINPGYSVEEEMEKAADFRKHIVAFLLADMLKKIKQSYIDDDARLRETTTVPLKTTREKQEE